jgi:hypothetical protein
VRRSSALGLRRDVEETIAERAQMESICTLSENPTTMNSNVHGSDLNFACPKL